MEMNEQNQQPLVSQATPIVPPLPIKQNNNLLLMIGGALLLILVGCGAYYAGLQQSKTTKHTSQTIVAQTPTHQPTAIPSPSSSNGVNDFKLRYFSTSDTFFDKEAYPSELVNTPESSLTPLSCTSSYAAVENGYITYDTDTKKQVPLTDASLLSQIQMLKSQYPGKTVNEILACTPQLGKKIILYSLGPCGGGCSGMPYVGVADDSGIHEAAKIQDTIAYFSCDKPLQLTKNNDFYFECGGGDGPAASATIYKLSLNTLAIIKVKKCSAGVDDTGKSFSTCE